MYCMYGLVLVQGCVITFTTLQTIDLVLLLLSRFIFVFLGSLFSRQQSKLSKCDLCYLTLMLSYTYCYKLKVGVILYLLL